MSYIKAIFIGQNKRSKSGRSGFPSILEARENSQSVLRRLHIRFMSSKTMVDMANRDPNNLNEHLQVMWDDVIGEPEGLRSTPCAWRCSHKCFGCTKNCCYLGLTTIFAPILAFLAAINFACLAFQHIWCFGPCLRTWKINFAFVRSIVSIMLAAVCAPLAENCGLYMSRIKVRYQRLPDARHDDQKDILVV